MKPTTLMAIGYANLPDAFQCGREAAQMAKNQLGMVAPDLVLVLGPANPHFQDFIEGVRLVTGEKGLIGIPSHQILTNDLLLSDARLVVLLKMEDMSISLASVDYSSLQTKSALTSLMSDFRQMRGNFSQQFEHKGMVLIDNSNPADKKNLIQEVTVDAGMDTWVLSLTPSPNLSIPLICNDQVRPRCLIGMECLSNNPFGIGAVSIGAFQHQPSVFTEALKSAYRSAVQRMEAPPAAAFVLFDFPIDPVTAKEIQMFVKHVDSPFYKLPFVGVSTASNAVKFPHQFGSVQKEAIVVSLVPS